MSIDSINFSSEGGTSESTWVCGWDEAPALCCNLAGGIVSVLGSPTRIYPTACPYFSGMVVKDVKIKPLGDFKSTSGYNQAEVKVSYGSPKAEDKSPTNPIDLFSISVQVAAEALSIKGSEYKWAVPVGNPPVSNKPVSEGELLTHKWIPQIELTLKCETMFRLFKLDKMRDLCSKINAGTLTTPEGTTFAAETVLFQGVQMEQKYTNQGFQYIPRSLKFLIRKQSWNKFWCEEYGDGTWQYVNPRPYDTDANNFSDLLTD